MTFVQIIKAAAQSVLAGKPSTSQLAKTTSTNLLSYKQPDKLSFQARKKILRNPYVYAALRNTTDEITGKWLGAEGYEPKDITERHLKRAPQILSAANTPLHRRQADHLRWNIDHRVERGWDTVLRQLLRARKHGKSVQEILWAWQTDGPWKKTWVIHDIIDHDPDYFNFRVDKHVNKLNGQVTYKNTLLYNPNASGIGGYPMPEGKFLVYSFDSENENSEGESILTKIDLFDWYQRNNFVFWMTDLNRYGSPLIVGTTPKTASDAQRQALLDAIDSVQQETGIVISEDEKINILQAQRNGASGFELLNQIVVAIISIVITGHAGSLEHGQYGTQAEAKVTISTIWENLMYALTTALDSVINRQLIPWFMWYNYPETLLFPKQQILPPRKQENTQEDTQEQNRVMVAVPQKYSQFNAQKTLFAEQMITVEDILVENALKQSFKVVEKVFQQPVINVIRTSKRPEDIEQNLQILKYEINIDEYKDLLYRSLMTAALLGHWQVYNAVKASEPQQFAESPDTGKLLETPIDIELAQELLLERKAISRRQFKRLDDLSKRQSFTIAGVERDGIIQSIQQDIAKALGDGISDKKELERIARDTFHRYGVTQQTPYHAATVFRTNMQTALNDAKWESIHQPEIMNDIVYLRYVTMDDPLVRPNHRPMHGVIRPPEDPVWQIWWPPNGFNCRCVIEIITAIQAQEQAIQPTQTLPNVNPDSGFGAGPGRWF